MKIEVIDGYRHSDEFIFVKGEIRVVPDRLGQMLVKYGFAKDPSGVMPTGPKPTEPVRLKPEDVYTVLGD